jgi:hypothetical protein
MKKSFVLFLEVSEYRYLNKKIPPWKYEQQQRMKKTLILT